MTPVARQDSTLSIQDYLIGERQSSEKYEYVDGQVFAMAGASLWHNLITSNLSALIWIHLRGQACFPVTSDMLVKTADVRYRYPDLMVMCQDDKSSDDYICEQPRLIVEVLSDHTRRKDKTIKRMEYLALPSLLEYVLIEQDRVEVEVQRRSDAWRSSYYYVGDEFTLESIEHRITVVDLYERVNNRDMLAYLASLGE